MSWIPGMCVVCGAENRTVNDNETCKPCVDAGHSSQRLPLCRQCGTMIALEEVRDDLCYPCQLVIEDEQAEEARYRQLRIESVLG